MRIILKRTAMRKPGMAIVWVVFFLMMTAIVTPPLIPLFAKEGEGGVGEGIPAIPAEPGPDDQRYMGWDTVYSLPLIRADYDLDKDGRTDYSVVRVVLRAFYYDDLSVDTVNEIGNKYYYARVFPRMDMVYVTGHCGFFYYLDLDQDGRYDLIWKDMDEDGLNGNEEIYDSPSGMFKEFIEKSN